MPIYSHSKINTFEQCPLKFKFRYIDKIVPELEKSIEAHLGGMVHNTLEWLYNQVKEKKIPSLDEVISYYAKEWEENYSPKIVIPKKYLTPADFFNKGIGFLINYYTKHKPFDDNTLETEKKIMLNLDEEGNYKIQGFIDRLSYNLNTNEFEIHDYKTANSIPQKEKIENDRQLALYSIAIKDIFGKDKEVCLVWHFLAHDKKVCLKKTNEQLSNLKRETLELIKKIESTKHFPSNKSVLCGWCEYNTLCEDFKNLKI